MVIRVEIFKCYDKLSSTTVLIDYSRAGKLDRSRSTNTEDRTLENGKTNSGSDIKYHGSSSSIKCHVFHHVGGRRHTPVVCNESRNPIPATIPVAKRNNQQTTQTSHYRSRPVEFSFRVGGNRSKERDRKSELVLRSTYQIFEWDRNNSDRNFYS